MTKIGGIGDLNHLDSIKIERERRLLAKSNPDPHAKVLWKLAIESCVKESTKLTLLSAYELACGLDYRHGGLSSEVYFAHSLRVASLSILFSEDKLEVGIIGLLHNVLEVANISVDFLSREYGRDVAQQISNLTVERELQWDLDYKFNYYNTLSEGRRAARIVKIIDKLDNLYVLNLNPDREIKLNYLQEITRYIVPMTAQELPFLVTYMGDLITETKLGCNERGV